MPELQKYHHGHQPREKETASYRPDRVPAGLPELDRGGVQGGLDWPWLAGAAPMVPGLPGFLSQRVT